MTPVYSSGASGAKIACLSIRGKEKLCVSIPDAPIKSIISNIYTFFSCYTERSEKVAPLAPLMQGGCHV